ncbi:MAG: hypothetical protein ACM357_03850 [Gemmatimonadota bacterium]
MTSAGPRLKSLAAVTGLLAACQGGSSPLESPEAGSASGPARLELGTVVDEDGRVTLPRTVFSPSDTVRLSFGRVPGADTLMVRWVRVDGDEAGVAVDSVLQAADGAAVHAFAASPAAGWSPGRYAVEVTAGGRRAGATTFEVR